MNDTLLVPLDGSELSEAALPWAELLARHEGCALLAVRVVSWPLYIGQSNGYASAEIYDHVRAAELEQATTYLADLKQRLAARNLAVDTVVAEGIAAQAIVDLAEERGAAAIVMATHGRGGLGRLVLGSVAAQVATQATVPLLLVRPTAGAAPPTPALRRLLVPLDGSPLAEQALELAQDLANQGAALVLVRVVAPVERRKPGIGVPETFVDEAATRAAVQEAESYLRQLADSRARSSRAVETLVRVGAATEEILATAQEVAADLIVASTHGRTGPRRWVLGSVADALVRRAAVPVFLVSRRMLTARITSPFGIEQLMTRDVVTVRVDEPLVAVIRKLLHHRISGAPVVDANGRLVGMISEHDLLAWQAQVLDELSQAEQLDPREYARRLETTPARDLMVQPPVSIEESASMMAAIRLFVQQRRRRLPVTRQGELVGMLSRTDVLRALAEQWQSIATQPGGPGTATGAR